VLKLLRSKLNALMPNPMNLQQYTPSEKHNHNARTSGLSLSIRW